MIKNNKLITIITVCYNSEKTIKDTIESVLNQTYRNIEYILIDGNSKDSTLKIIKSYEKKFKERGIIYKWISEPDKGIYDAMNKGIDMASGKWIGIINSDDWYEKTAVEEICKYINEDIQIISGNMLYTDYYKKPIYLINRNNKDLEKLNIRMTINHPTTVVKKEVYDMVGKFDESYKITADYDFISRCYCKGINFLFIPFTIASMREGGVSNNKKFYLKLLKENFRVRKNNFSLLSALIAGMIDIVSLSLRILKIKK
ncbi:MAG: glycosyltransferase [Arcobacter sp.]|nr:glycosyltransferase [Arcobacter sp.]